MYTKAELKEQYQKAEAKAKAIELVEMGADVEEAFAKYGFKISRLSYPRIRKRYQKHGLTGLIEKRGRKPAKATEKIVAFIETVKREDADLSGEDIRRLVAKEFEVTLDRTHINRIVKKLGLSSRVGRRPGKPVKKEVHIDHAGSFFLKGALQEMGITDTIVRTILKHADGVEDPGLERMQITRAKPRTLEKKVESLILMPAFGMQRLWHFHTVYPRRGMGYITGSRETYRYHTMDNFLRELPRLDLHEELTGRLARCYVEAFALEFETLDEQTFYLDCHKKVVWTKKNIPKAKHITRNRILKCLDVYFIHDHKGRPLLPMTRPGDSNFLDEMFELISVLEEAVGDRVVKISVFDREGLAVHVFRRFEEEGRRFITVLRENQCRMEDFEIEEGARWKPCRGARRIMEAKKVLKDSKTGGEFRVRAVLIRDEGTGKLAAAVTDIKPGEMRGDQIVETYVDRWPKQENSFKQMKPGLYLDTNHGLGAKELKENRVARRRAEKLLKGIKAKEKKIEGARKAVEKARESLSRAVEGFESRVEVIEGELRGVEEELALEPDQGRRTMLVKRLRRLREEKDRRVDAYVKKRRRLEDTMAERGRYIEARARELESLRKKLKDVDLEEPLYEIDTGKDHLMTLFEVALCNADIWLKENVIHGMERSDFATSRNLVYGQSGFYRELKDRIEVRLDNYSEPEHQRLVEHACESFNKMRIRTSYGKRLKINVTKNK